MEREAMLTGFQALLDHLNQGVCLVGTDLKVAAVNRRFSELCNLPVGDIRPGMPFQAIFPDDGQDGEHAADEDGSIVRRCVEGALCHTKQHYERHGADGRILDIEFGPMPGFGFAVICTDATERHRAKAVPRESEERFRVLADPAPVMMWQADSQGQKVFCNQQWFDFIGGNQDEELGHSWLDGIHPEDMARCKSVYDDAIRNRQSYSLEYRLRRADGEYRWMLSTGVPRSDEEGEFAGFIGSSIDITGRKLAEEAMREAKESAEATNRTKSEFLANMSHELRTPLNAVMGFSEIMKDEIFGPLGNPSYRDYASDIYESGRHLLNLINDILDVSKAEAGKIELSEDTIDVNELIATCIRLVRARAEAGDVVLHIRSEPEPPLLVADERRLKQILLNLLSNAIKFTPARGEVTVTAARNGDGAFVLNVSDTGIGIADSDMAKALAPFGQVDSRLARKYEGTGLGLPLSKALVEQHGGRLELDSEVGVGTETRVIFPRERVVSRDHTPSKRQVAG